MKVFKRLLVAYTKDKGPEGVQLAFAEYFSHWGPSPSQGDHSEDRSGHWDWLHVPGFDTGCPLPACCQICVRPAALFRFLRSRSRRCVFLWSSIYNYQKYEKRLRQLSSWSSFSLLFWSLIGLLEPSPTFCLSQAYLLDQADHSLTGWEPTTQMICRMCSANPSPSLTFLGTDRETCLDIWLPTGRTLPEPAKSDFRKGSKDWVRNWFEMKWEMTFFRIS